MRTLASNQSSPGVFVRKRSPIHITLTRTTNNNQLFKDQVLPLQRKPGCACGGDCPSCRDEGAAIQTKLRIGRPGDKYEQEADRVAGQVMRMPETAVQCKSCSCGKPAGPMG